MQVPLTTVWFMFSLSGRTDSNIFLVSVLQLMISMVRWQSIRYQMHP